MYIASVIIIIACNEIFQLIYQRIIPQNVIFVEYMCFRTNAKLWNINETIPWIGTFRTQNSEMLKLNVRKIYCLLQSRQNYSKYILRVINVIAKFTFFCCSERISTIYINIYIYIKVFRIYLFIYINIC